MTRPLTDRQRAAIARKRALTQAPDAEAKRAAIAAAIRAEKREDAIRALCRDAEQLYHKLSIKAIAPEAEAAERADLKVRAARLGVRLVIYNRGVDCASIMALPQRDAEAAFWELSRGEWARPIAFESSEDEPQAQDPGPEQLSFFDED